MDNIDLMAGNLTTQFRGMSKVVNVLSNGDLSRQSLTVEEREEVPELRDGLNTLAEMLDCAQSSD